MVNHDLRKVVGSAITCKATHVVALPECNRRFSALAKTKILNGIVHNVIVDKSNPTSRVQTYIEAKFDLENGRSKIVKVHLRYVLLKEIEVPVLPPTEAQVVEVMEEVVAEEETVAEIAPIVENNDAMIEMVQMVRQAATNAVDEVMGALPTANEAIQRNNELIEAINALNHSDTETEDDNTQTNIPQTPIATSIDPLLDPPIPLTTLVKNVVFEAHGTKWYNVPQGMRSVNGEVPFKEWDYVFRQGIFGVKAIMRMSQSAVSTYFCNCSRKNNCMIRLY
jgi:hypothetical protein